MKLNQLEDKLRAAQGRYAAARKEMEAASKETARLMLKIEQCKHPEGYPSIEAVMAADWYDIERGGFYDQATKVLNDWCAAHPGLHQGMGLWGDTRQRVLSIKLNQNRPLEDQLGTVAALPLIRPNVEGVRRFSIFEHTLSEHGSYTLECRSNGSFVIVKSTYGTARDKASFSDLKTALALIYQAHPYQLRGEED